MKSIQLLIICSTLLWLGGCDLKQTSGNTQTTMQQAAERAKLRALQQRTPAAKAAASEKKSPQLSQ